MALAIRGVVLATCVAACSVLQPGERLPLGVSNGTDLVVIISVNGQVIGQFQPGGGQEIGEDALPPLPWTVEARTVSGRLLTSMHVEPGQVFRETLPDGSTHVSGAGARLDLSCGRFEMWAGPPMSGPAPGPGVPGDCAP